MSKAKKRLLIVEDDEIDRLSFERFVKKEKMPYSCRFACSIAEAKELIKKEEFDAVLLDYILPDGNAFDLFPSLNGLPFILITSEGNEEVAVKAMKSGAYDYLIKDIHGNYLKTIEITIDRALRRKKTEDELVRYREHLEELVKKRTEKLKREIAERKKAERSLKKARDELERRVEERTAELREANKNLKREIKERIQAEMQVKKSLKEKEVLLKEIHHRVKNNMQVILSLLRLQSSQVTDKNSLEILKSSQNRIRTMALVHEKLYQSEDLANIDFGDYIKSLTTNLFHTYMNSSLKVEVNVKAEKIPIEINYAIPCGLIVNELVTNSLKYAFPPSWKGEGRIDIVLRLIDKEDVELIVQDNGIGIPEDINLRESKSMGLSLVHILGEDQLGGRIEVERNGGTKFKIRFSIAK